VGRERTRINAAPCLQFPYHRPGASALGLTPASTADTHLRITGCHILAVHITDIIA
jgi:hypothetical protein